MSSPSLNKNYKIPKVKPINAQDLIKSLIKGDIVALSKAITLLESRLEKHKSIANQIIDQTLPYTGKSIRIGITGVPGVGKSTFIEAFGNYLTNKGKKVAVLAIDPSSQKRGGSILGDKTRMETLVNNPNVYIRPSPSKGALGGVAQQTRASILLCEAAGFDVIIVETVGVGQSEIAVHGMVDFFLLLMLSGAGDELQGIKRGIMEMADSIAITKADGDNVINAKKAKQRYKNAMHLFPANANEWIPEVVHCSSIEQKGIEDVWGIIEKFERHTKLKGYFEDNRNKQAKYWMYEKINEELKRRFYENENIANQLPELEQQIIEGRISPYTVADKLLKND
ncbi:MAG: methylmalonyl Co-A mutase-associated GTPase MeaB [Flavobacteriales bacterium]|jgi:LAO/AO transport system kinase|nr:methylmalonyl Co-A mutase-associated GTPase MeaB [Flavobacteriales bacterium]